MNRADRETDQRRQFGALCESLRPDLLRFAFWLGRDRALGLNVELLSSETAAARDEALKEPERPALPPAAE